MRLARLLAFSLAGVVAGGCHSITPPTQSIVVSVDADKTTIGVGESATFTITALNAGYQALTVKGRDDCLVYFQIFSTGGLSVYDTRAACTGSTVTQTLDVDGTIARTFTWDGRDLAGSRLPSGLYVLRPSLALESGGYPGAPVTIAVE